jgi:predicted nucleic acid-binding protein
VGPLSLPASGLVYLDANPIIYTVEKHPVYGPLLQPLWQAAQAKTIEVVTSELALMETLVGPLKSGNTTLERDYEQALLGTDLRLLPITQSILRDAAHLRATTKLKTPTRCTLPRLDRRGACSLSPTMPASVVLRVCRL